MNTREGQETETQPRPKRPKINRLMRADQPDAPIACREGRKSGWLTKIYWNGKTWVAHSSHSKIALGDDMVCYLDRQPRSPTEIVLIKKVFATFCVGEVITVN
jgi:hypothetical protein